MSNGHDLTLLRASRKAYTKLHDTLRVPYGELDVNLVRLAVLARVDELDHVEEALHDWRLQAPGLRGGTRVGYRGKGR